MSYFGLLGIGFIIFLIIAMMICIYFGRKYALWLKSRAKGKKHGAIQITQTAVFALLGLLVAFTFAGALSKFDHRRHLIIEEANAVSTLYARFDLLPEDRQQLIKDLFKQYLVTRIKTYQVLPDIKESYRLFAESLKMQNKLWTETVKACQQADQVYVCMLILPAMNTTFDDAITRASNTQMHPPLFIFFLLVGVVLVGALLVGFNISGRKITSSLHIVSYSVVISIVVFAIVDMEYPRLGFIQIGDFDNVLVDELHRIESQ